MWGRKVAGQSIWLPFMNHLSSVSPVRPHTPFLLANDGSSEHQYLSLVRTLIAHGVNRSDRTGVGTRSLHGMTMRFDLSDESWPLLTTKKIRWKDIANELFWFLSGATNIRPLLQNGVTIWSEWPHKKYVSSTGDTISLKEFEQRLLDDEVFSLTWGDLGPVYGKQWRRWEGPDGRVYDQVSDLLVSLRHNPDSRRHIISGWNVAEIDTMALPPCHLLYQYFVADGVLSGTLYQRSCDVGLGVPFNVPSAALLLRLLAQQSGLKPGNLWWVGHDVHLYNNHIEKLEEKLLPRVPRPFPKLTISPAATLFDYTLDNLTLSDYDPYPGIRLPVAV